MPHKDESDTGNNSLLMASNPLSSNPFRDRFVIDPTSAVYLDGNSLGRLPKATEQLMHRVVREQWGTNLIGSWNTHWLPLSRRIGDKIGQLIGAAPGETLVCDSTSINLYKLAWGLLQQRGRRTTIVTDVSNFPTDLYIMSGLVQQSSEPLQLRCCELSIESEDSVIAQLERAVDDDTALVYLSHVHFKSGYAFNLERVTALAHARGAKVLWDLSHSVGAMPIDLRKANADAAVGCTYKYLNGGPGAPAFLYVRREGLDALANPIQGWFGAAKPFDFSLEFQPHPAVERFLVGTHPVLSLAAIEPGVDLVLEAGIHTLRQRSVELTNGMLQQFDLRLDRLGYSLQSPRDPDLRGSHLSFGHPHAWQITQDLIQNHRVIPDFREPDTIRFGITPLYTVAEEVDRAIAAMETSVVQGTFHSFPASRHGVT
jgi:kynureninase